MGKVRRECKGVIQLEVKQKVTKKGWIFGGIVITRLGPEKEDLNRIKRQISVVVHKEM